MCVNACEFKNAKSLKTEWTSKKKYGFTLNISINLLPVADVIY